MLRSFTNALPGSANNAPGSSDAVELWSCSLAAWSLRGPREFCNKQRLGARTSSEWKAVIAQVFSFSVGCHLEIKRSKQSKERRLPANLRVCVCVLKPFYKGVTRWCPFGKEYFEVWLFIIWLLKCFLCVLEVWITLIFENIYCRAITDSILPWGLIYSTFSLPTQMQLGQQQIGWRLNSAAMRGQGEAIFVSHAVTAFRSVLFHFR